METQSAMLTPIIQIIFNIIVSVLGVFIGWIIKITLNQINDIKETVREANHTQERNYREAMGKITDIAISLPQNYVHKNDFNNFVRVLNERFDKLENKIDNINSHEKQ